MSIFVTKQVRPCLKSSPSSSTGAPEKELREQLHQEIENKSKSCSNPTYECSIPRIDGFEYCIRHILRDPRGSYRQCGFTYSNGKKCQNAVPKHDTRKDPAMTTLCFEHSRQTQLQKTHASVGKLRRAETNEALLHNLAHHINVEDVQERTPECEQDEEIDVVSPHVAPFVAHDQVHSLSAVTATVRKRRRVLDYASDSSDNEEPPSISNTARSYEYNESDNESVDSQDEDPLKHAGIYTRQEAIRISESKLTKLQGLYIDQITRLHHVLKERRRRYLTAIRKEREVLCSIHDQLKETPRERMLYEQLKALNSYHRRHGMEAVLYKKYKEKRARASESYSLKGPGFQKCSFTEGGVKCGERALPCCKFCRKHILEDKKQILFRACEKEKSGIVCQEAIPCIFDDATCVLHLSIAMKRQYVQRKYESETEDDDDTNNTHTTTTTTNYNNSNNQQNIGRCDNNKKFDRTVCEPKQRQQHAEEHVAFNTDTTTATSPLLNTTTTTTESNTNSNNGNNVTISHESVNDATTTTTTTTATTLKTPPTTTRTTTIEKTTLA